MLVFSSITPYLANYCVECGWLMRYDEHGATAVATGAIDHHLETAHTVESLDNDEPSVIEPLGHEQTGLGDY